jgi:hypothetical protein
MVSISIRPCFDIFDQIQNKICKRLETVRASIFITKLLLLT